MNEKIALMADAHANPRALKAAIDDAKELGAELFLCLGDMTWIVRRRKRCPSRILSGFADCR